MVTHTVDDRYGAEFSHRLGGDARKTFPVLYAANGAVSNVRSVDFLIERAMQDAGIVDEDHVRNAESLLAFNAQKHEKVEKKFHSLVDECEAECKKACHGAQTQIGKHKFSREIRQIAKDWKADIASAEKQQLESMAVLELKHQKAYKDGRYYARGLVEDELIAQANRFFFVVDDAGKPITREKNPLAVPRHQHEIVEFWDGIRESIPDKLQAMEEDLKTRGMGRIKDKISQSWGELKKTSKDRLDNIQDSYHDRLARAVAKESSKGSHRGR